MSEERDKSFLVRLTEEEHERIRRASEHHGVSMQDWFRNNALKSAAEVLDCQHPIEFRKVYPWSDTCMRCGLRLRG
jgi:uncharacterized protein (DUF1778 family)